MWVGSMRSCKEAYDVPEVLGSRSIHFQIVVRLGALLSSNVKRSVFSTIRL